MQIKIKEIAKDHNLDKDDFSRFLMYQQNEICVYGTLSPSIEETDIPHAIELYSVRHEEKLKKKNQYSSVTDMKLTTGFDFQGFFITEYLDVIFDEMLVGIGLGKALTSSVDNWLSTLTGREATEMIEKLNDVKVQLRNRVIEKAAKLGANALIGIDFESSRLGSLLMVSFTATAVKIEKIVEPLPVTEGPVQRNQTEKT